MHIYPNFWWSRVEVSNAQISVLPLITLLWHRLIGNTPFLPPKNKEICCLCSTLVHQFKMAFCLTPLVSWRRGLIWESLAWYVWNIYLRVNCQAVSKSLITRQQREAVLSGSYHFHNMQLWVDIYGQQSLCFNKLGNGKRSLQDIWFKCWKL